MYPRVKEVVQVCEKGGLPAVKDYFSQDGMEIDPNTWCGHIKKSIDDGYNDSVLAEIHLLIEKFNFYENVSEKEKRRRNSSVDGERNSETEEEIDGESKGS